LGGYALTVPAAIAVLFAVWYVTGLITADRACKHLFEPATANDLQALVRAGERATASPLPTHAYDLPFAYALELYARRLAAQITARGAAADVDQLTQTRADVLRQALAHAEKSLEYTNTPDASYVTLASIALAAGDVDRLNSASDEAVRRDPNNYQARWLRAEAYLARGDRDAALREAEAALEIYHVSPEAASALARARGQSATQAEVASILLEWRRRKATSERSAEELLEVARRLTEKGKLRRARIKLLTAASRSNGPCPDCHRQLAIVYEKMNRFNEAITEWQAYREAAPERAASEQVAVHIEALKPKLAANP
jgi:tetratricopeptide (TPR) repeat protein